MWVCYQHVCLYPNSVAMKPEEDIESCNCNYRWLWADIWGLRIKPQSCERAASDLNLFYLAPKNIYLDSNKDKIQEGWGCHDWELGSGHQLPEHPEHKHATLPTLLFYFPPPLSRPPACAPSENERISREPDLRSILGEHKEVWWCVPSDWISCPLTLPTTTNPCSLVVPVALWSQKASLRMEGNQARKEREQILLQYQNHNCQSSNTNWRPATVQEASRTSMPYWDFQAIQPYGQNSCQIFSLSIMRLLDSRCAFLDSSDYILLYICVCIFILSVFFSFREPWLIWVYSKAQSGVAQNTRTWSRDKWVQREKDTERLQ